MKATTSSGAYRTEAPTRIPGRPRFSHRQRRRVLTERARRFASSGSSSFRPAVSALRSGAARAWLSCNGRAGCQRHNRRGAPPRLTEAERDTIKGGGTLAQWKPARRAQIDRDGRWTLKRGKKREQPPLGTGIKRAAPSEIVIPAFGYKNHVGIDRAHGLVRRFTVTHAAAADGRQLGRLLDGNNLASSVWADTAYRSQANLRLLDRRGLVPEFQRRKPRGKPMPARGGLKLCKLLGEVLVLLGSLQ